ncbi:MAG: hypothetical protein LBQ28_09160 [Prevotellaceae bacterium]|jgi:hypothetical protein|nr:hypothetical protein [Prevotellaceae bacterium]
MLILKCKIIIYGKDNKKITFDYVSSVEIVTSITDLTDTAKIVVPRKIQWKEQPLTKYINRGDKIEIQLGYENNNIETVFTGYIKTITSRTRITIECENEMWQLKQKPVPAQICAQFDFEIFMKKYAADVNVVLPNKEKLNFGEVKIGKDVNVANVLEQLKKNNPFYSFFRENKLYAIMGQTALNETGSFKHIIFNAQKNIINCESLKYTHADDVNVRVKAISILANNKRLAVEVPDKKTDGELRTFHDSRYKTEPELRKYAELKLAELKVDNISGSFTAFGIPFVRKADRVTIFDKINADIDGKVFNVKSVKYNFGEQGYRQTIELGDKYK